MGIGEDHFVRHALIASGIVWTGLALAAAQSRPVSRPDESRPEPSASASRSGAAPTAVGGDRVRHGEYLVHAVAMCTECHTPRDENGKLIRLRLLEGAQVPVRSPWASQPWAFRAPPLAGLPGGWTEEDVIKLLMTGQGPNGRSPAMPMPAFRMNREDAAAVAAYLKSLASGSRAAAR